ncbi:MAG TPA: glutamyl-tRNA reductase [Roseiflexaceae bacterium]|nr:glutamyl-tRNA reductase [Roseiflexaceae bacterium]
MQIMLVGVHQRTAPVAVRERLAFTAAELPAALAALRDHAAEGFIVSTCNRVEVCGLVADEMEGQRALGRFLAEWHGLDPALVAPHLYVHAGTEAVRHVHRLAAGLDSMVLGEDQIVVQLKEALVAAHAAGAIGGALHRLLHGALATGKQVRTQTGIAAGRLSVVSVAVDMARQVRGGLAGARVLVVGAGRMAELVLKHLAGEPDVAATVINRTPGRAAELAARHGATALPIERLEEGLRAADVVIAATAAPGLVIDAAMAARALAGRERLLLLDLAVPRDIERGAGDVPGVTLLDVDDMRPVCEANRAARAAEIARAEALVEGAVERYTEWWAAQQAVPTIRALRERAEAIRLAELERTLARCPELTEREREAIRALSAAIVNKLLHGPITTIKSPEASAALIQAARELFRLPADV